MAVFGLLATTRGAQAEEKEEAGDPKDKRGTGLLVAGGVAFGGAYAASYVAAMYALVKHQVDCESARRDAAAAPPGIERATRGLDASITCILPPAERHLFVPIAGPFMTLGEGRHGAGAIALLVADASAQIAGLGLVAIGAAMHLAPPPVHVAPSVTSAMTGVSAFGTF
jgi:hypothetical protein